MVDINAGETLLSLFTLAFTSWAGVVLWVGMGLRRDGRDIRDELKAVSQQLNEYVLSTEKRLTYLETQIKSLILRGNGK